MCTPCGANVREEERDREWVHFICLYNAYTRYFLGRPRANLEGSNGAVCAAAAAASVCTIHNRKLRSTSVSTLRARSPARPPSPESVPYKTPAFIAAFGAYKSSTSFLRAPENPYVPPADHLPRVRSYAYRCRRPESDGNRYFSTTFVFRATLSNTDGRKSIIYFAVKMTPDLCRLKV